MSLPRMSIHIGDYKKDTGHLRAAGHGAYFLLILHYWATGGLPDDDRQLAAIACMTDREWKQWKPILQSFFNNGWKHKRIDIEIAEAMEKYRKRAAAGGKGGSAPRMVKQNGSNAPAKQKQPITDNPKEGGGGDARASLISPEAMTLTTEIAAIVGYPTPDHWPPGWCGAPYRVEAMLQGGWQREIMLASTREIMAKRGSDPPDGIKYFEKAFARAHAQQSAPLPVVNIKPAEIIHETGRQHRGGRSAITAAIDSHIERFERESDDSGEVRETAARLLSNG